MKELYERTPFTSNGTINREMIKQATRHDLEEVLQWKWINRSAFWKIKRENMIAAGEVSGDPLYETTRGKEFREMAQDYVSGRVSQVEFQNKFNDFVHDKLWLPKEQQFVATNILEKLDAIKNDNKLFNSITSDLQKYLTDHNSSHFDDVHKKINDDFKKYRRDPRFRKKIMDILWNTAWLTKDQLDEEINKFIKHQKALANASASNLQIKLDLLTNGKWAYQINNKDRENWLFKLWHKFDKMPRYWQALTAVWITATGTLVAAWLPAIWLWWFTVMWLKWAAFAGTATMSTLVWAKNFVKKWTHHTKEQNTYEKNLVRDYEKEIAQMKEREKIRTEKDSEWKYTHWRLERYRAKRQLELYGKSTQSELQNENTWNTKELADFIYTALDRYDTLTPEEKNALNCTLLDSKARLETYWNMGHNFLKSKDKSQIERDFYNLENALNLAATRVLKDPNATLKDVSLVEAFDEDGKIVDYNDLLNLYKKDYNSATKKFRWERAWLATKRWLWTALITFGSAMTTQAITHTWMFARDAVPWTSGTPSSTTTTRTWNVTDNYWLWKYELSGGNKIFNAAHHNISGLNSTDTVTLHLWAGTDWTHVRAGSILLNHQTYIDKLNQVKDVINHSSLNNRDDLIRQISKWFSTSGFTNTDLHWMRCLEAIEETVRWAWNFAWKLNISYDATTLDVDGLVPSAASRMSKVFLEISKFTPWEPWRKAVKGGIEWLVLGLPWFSNTFKRKNNGKGKSTSNTPLDEWDGGWGNEWNNEWWNNEWPWVILPPVEPDYPTWPTEEEKPREKITWKRKWVVTRGHPINVTKADWKIVIADIDDLWDNYPWTWKLLDPEDTAKEYIEMWKWISSGKFSSNIFSEEDKRKLTDLAGNEPAQIDYLKSKIIEDRNAVDNSGIKREFDRSLQISKEWIKKYSKEILWDVDSRLLNKFLSDDRIHLVSDRDFISITWWARWVIWCFRNIEGDIFVGYGYLAQFKDRILSWNKDGYYTELDFAMHTTVVHEMVHSMSTMNYLVSEWDWGKLEYDPRRLWLMAHRWWTNWNYLWETWRSLNEASTESLAWEIISRWYRSIGLDISPFERKWKSYGGFIEVIDQLKEIDHIKNEDFWKAMLIRKRAKDKHIELDTPLFELVWKVDGRQEENWKIKYSRPNYYNLISNSMDFAHTLFNERNVDGFETRWIIDFIIKKDIIILKDYVQSQHKKLSDVFDKDLLTKDGKDFRQEILDAYNGR